MDTLFILLFLADTVHINILKDSGGYTYYISIVINCSKLLAYTFYIYSYQNVILYNIEYLILIFRNMKKNIEILLFENDYKK